MSRNVPLGYLRMFLTLMVVAHHAVLAYHPYAPPPPPSLDGESMLWGAFPVVDSAKGKGIDLFVAFNDLGRVWQKNEVSHRWHHGFGGGLYFSPAQLAVFNLLVGKSKEGFYPYFSMGLRF